MRVPCLKRHINAPFSISKSKEERKRNMKVAQVTNSTSFGVTRSGYSVCEKGSELGLKSEEEEGGGKEMDIKKKKLEQKTTNCVCKSRLKELREISRASCRS